MVGKGKIGFEWYYIVEEAVNRLAAYKARDGKIPLAPVRELRDVFDTICLEHDVVELKQRSESDFNLALLTLADWGHIVFFADIPDIVGVEPTFLPKKVLGVLKDKLKSENGITKLSTFKSSLGFGDEMEQVMSLLERIGSCVKLGSDYLFPEFLSIEPPPIVDQWHKSGLQESERTFAVDYVPVEIIPRILHLLITNLNQRIGNVDVWQTGFFIILDKKFDILLSTVLNSSSVFLTDDSGGQIKLFVRWNDDESAAAHQAVDVIVVSVKACLQSFSGLAYIEATGPKSTKNDSGQISKANTVSSGSSSQGSSGSSSQSGQAMDNGNIDGNGNNQGASQGSETEAGPDEPGAQGSSPEPYDVFLSHSGKQKHGIVDQLREKLERMVLRVFVDYEELKGGGHAPTKNG